MERDDLELSNRWSPDAELHIVYRFASGKLAHLLFDRIQLEELQAPRNRRLLLLEDRPQVLRWALERENWRILIQSDRCLFAVDFPQREAFSRLLQRYPDISRASFQVYTGEAASSQDRVNRITQIMSQCRDQYGQKMQTFFNSHNDQRKPAFSQEVRFFVAGHNYLQDACISALQNLGCGAERFSWKNPLYRFIRSTAWFNEYQKSPFDTAVFLNSTPRLFMGNDLIRRLPVRTISWFVDNPRRFVNCSRNLEDCDGIAVFDSSYIPFLQKYTAAPVWEVRTGYGIDPEKAKSTDAFADIDVAFVGELGKKSNISLEQGLMRIAPELVKKVNGFIKELDITQSLAFSDEIGERLKADGIDYYGAWVEYLENQATALRRCYYLDAVADLGLKIFGEEEWGNSTIVGALADCYAGRRLDYATELPALYATAKINVNIFHVQCVAAPNPRVYDVLACGGFLLTQYNPGLEEEFIPNRHLVVFHSREELREKVRYYLQHPQERREIAEEGQKYALAKYGYNDRMQSFLACLNPIDRSKPYVYLCR